MIAALERYAAEGRFPRNRGVAARRVPIFVDENGRRCAMAHLIEVSGQPGLVARIAATANFARIPELAHDSELSTWLEGAGISLEEAALIQPSYGPYEKEEEKPKDGVMAAGTVMAFGFGFPAVALNLRTDQTWPRRQQNGIFGLLTGASLLALGLTDALYDHEVRGTGYIQLTVGGIASVLSIMNLARGPIEPQRQVDEAEVKSSSIPEPRRGRSVGTAMSSAASHVVIRPGTEGEPQLGVRVTF